MGMMRSSMFGITKIFCKEESKQTSDFKFHYLSADALAWKWLWQEPQELGAEIRAKNSSGAPSSSALDIFREEQAGAAYLWLAHLYGGFQEWLWQGAVTRALRIFKGITL